MFTNIPNSNPLLFAQIATYSKGQETQASVSDEKKELDRELRQQIVKKDTFHRSEETAPGTEGGNLA